jgi:L-aminopeptidase/D-esterase-like protein
MPGAAVAKRGVAGAAIALALGVFAASPQGEQVASPTRTRGITDVAGITVGHFTRPERPTGCTVVLAGPEGAVASVDVRGGAPATRETDLLHPLNTVERVHAIVLSGGSAFGLDAAAGVMRFLEERGIGFDTRVARVPIVPGASLFDLGLGDAKIRPTADCGYRAASVASGGPVDEGDVGAGAGATVGKLAGASRAMKAGLGTSSIVLDDGLVVGAIVAVNALGDVIDPATGRTIAGVRTPDGRGLADARVLLRASLPREARPGENTTIGVVATNAVLTKTQAAKVAQMAHDGFARAVQPAHMPFDGDTIFALATGTHDGPGRVDQIGALAADAMSEAIVRAARASRGLPGLPSASTLAGGER